MLRTFNAISGSFNVTLFFKWMLWKLRTYFKSTPPLTVSDVPIPYSCVLIHLSLLVPFLTIRWAAQGLNRFAHTVPFQSGSPH
jgi:hypothetical protein